MSGLTVQISARQLRRILGERDLVQVVRCKDCESCLTAGSVYVCKRHNALGKISPESYCSYGRKKVTECTKAQ